MKRDWGRKVGRGDVIEGYPLVYWSRKRERPVEIACPTIERGLRLRTLAVESLGFRDLDLGFRLKWPISSSKGFRV